MYPGPIPAINSLGAKEQKFSEGKINNNNSNTISGRDICCNMVTMMLGMSDVHLQ